MNTLIMSGFMACKVTIAIINPTQAQAVDVAVLKIKYKTMGNERLHVKLATGEHGAAAAVSHTGSLAGSNAAYRALFERAGMMVVEDFEALVEAAAGLWPAATPVHRRD
jgi:hypothetical protein